MARTQSLGALIGMTIFILLFIVTLALSILFYVNWKETVKEIAASQQEVQWYVNDVIKQDNEHQAKLSLAQETGGDTVVEQYRSQRRRLLMLLDISDADALMGATGVDSQGNDDLTPIKGKIFASYSGALKNLETLYEENNIRFPDENSVMPRVIQDLAQVVVQVNDQKNRLLQSESQLKKDLADVNQTMRTQLAALNEQIEKYKSDLETMGQERASAIEENTTRITSHGEEVERKAQAKEEEIQILNNDIAKLQENIRSMSLVISSLEKQLQSIPRIKPTSLYEPDGQILSSNTQTKTVHINLGKSDKVMPGLTFEVFDKERGVQVDETNERLNRGKATIEVIRVNENNSLCRVIYQRYGSTIQPTDLVANIAYDRSKKYRFVVYGDIDLNNDGISQPFEKVRMKDLIKRYGGIILENPPYDEDTEQFNIDVSTDYIVMGVPPKAPDAEMQELALDDPAIEKDLEDMNRKIIMYENLKEQALKYYIPVLNQNRALALMGVYQN